MLAEGEGAVLLQVLVEIDYGVEAAQGAEVEQVSPADVLGLGRETVVGARLVRARGSGSGSGSGSGWD